MTDDDLKPWPNAHNVSTQHLAPARPAPFPGSGNDDDLKPWPNAHNVSTQHLATLWHGVATCVERGGQTHATFSSFSTQHVNVYVLQAPGTQEMDLTRMPWRNNVP